MNSEQKLEKQFEVYQEAAKSEQNVDVAALMISALENQNKNLVSGKWKKWAYFVSLGIPPCGLLLALKFYFSDEEDAKHVANMCVALTLLSLGLVYLFGKLLFSSAGTSLDQIQQIKPSDIQQFTE